MNRVFTFIRQLDWWIIVPITYLIALSFVVQHAILFKTKGVTLEFDLSSHTYAIIASLAIALIATYFRPIKWLRVFWAVYIVGIIALIFLAVSGTSEAERWINIGQFQFQPTEIVKLASIGILAGTIAKFSKHGESLKSIVLSLSLILLPMTLIAVQPDLGSSVVFLLIWGLMVIASPIRLTGIGLVGVVAVVIAILSLPLLAPYQQDRISSFLNPSGDTQGSSYNSIQASIAIGSGGLLGNGLDSGSQSQLNFLPAQHTDFAFAVTAEKLGLVGVLTVIVAITVVMLRMTYLAWITHNLYWRLLLVGVVGMLLAHSLINIGMNVGLLPVTGLPLPFLSYGGTFMFVSLTGVLLGVILSSYVRNEKDDKNQTLQG